MKTKTDDYSELLKRCREIVECDTARISRPLVDGRMYLIIGFKRNTKDDGGYFVDSNGIHRDFDYVEESLDYVKESIDYVKESIVASGFTEDELIASAKEYVKVQGMTWEDYFEGIEGKGKPFGKNENASNKKCRHTRKGHFSPNLCEMLNEGCDGCPYLR